jgi:hypothetical protein
VQKDILTSLLLPEILLKIISQPPSKNCLDLAQSCRFHHNFVKLNAGRICNEAIQRHFPIEAAPLKSGLEAEWLVYMHTRVNAEEGRIQELHFDHEAMLYKLLLSRPTPGCNLPSHSSAKQLPFGLLGEVKSKDKLHLEVSSPGPQYLYFLEQGLLVVGTGDFQIQIGQSEKEAVVGGKRYFFDLRDWLVLEPFLRRPHLLW